LVTALLSEDKNRLKIHLNAQSGAPSIILSLVATNFRSKIQTVNPRTTFTMLEISAEC
jgi:hypothetical protein